MTILDHTEYDDQHFDRLQLPTGQLERVVFTGCTFTDCAFSEVRFKGCRFYECTFKRCNLGVAGVDNCTFVSTRFEQCKLIGINWTTAQWGSRAPRKIDFYNSDISYCVFNHLELPGLHIKGCTVHDADFAEVDLTGADCRETDFAETRFLQTNLTKADFTGARNYNISPLDNTLKGAKFALPEAASLLRHLEIVLVEPSVD